MNDLGMLALAALGGAALGVIFYEGLYYTIRWGMESKLPALWFSGSLLLRSALVLAGFYAISGGNGYRLIACLPGFLLARVLVTRYRSAGGTKPLKPAGAP